MKKHIVCLFVVLVVSYLLYTCMKKEDDCGCGHTEPVKQGFNFANKEDFFPEYTLDIPPMDSDSPYYKQTKEAFFNEYTLDEPKMESDSPFYKDKNLLPTV